MYNGPPWRHLFSLQRCTTTSKEHRDAKTKKNNNKRYIYICTAHSPETHRAHQLDRKVTHQNNEHSAFFALGCKTQDPLAEKNNLRHRANDRLISYYLSAAVHPTKTMGAQNRNLSHLGELDSRAEQANVLHAPCEWSLKIQFE